MSALLAGTLLALAALGYVLWPLLTDAPRAAPRGRPGRAAAPEMESAVEALREIEFDRATGKLSDSDYSELKASYTRDALAELRAGGSASHAGAATVVDPAEAAIRRYRDASSCARCGPRPEPDALYCSSCGNFLPGSCAGCGAPVTAAGAHFCTGCGEALAA